jgi:hypothetical protein
MITQNNIERKKERKECFHIGLKNILIIMYQIVQN